ncbi:hypothetical protein ABZ912_29425 [Nonomuraea angiospora]|uniref:hypothetical protein n=1 Tax=Nonomuraea angiospora TaxID=46172 RepID=UPI0033FC5D55
MGHARQRLRTPSGRVWAAERSLEETYAGLAARFEARGGYEADVRAEIALHGLDRSRPLRPIVPRRRT